MKSKQKFIVPKFARSTPTMSENWATQKAKFKKRFPTLTDEDLRYEEGKKGEMWNNIRKKLNLDKDELHKMIVSG
ncbi:MAG: general stress protein CsbD [Bacteroidota bacterium]